MKVLVKVLAGLTVSGALLGVAWAWIAPPIHTITGLAKSGERVDGFLGREADNVFVASAMLIGLLSMLAVIAAVLVWQWRARRGPRMVLALWAGMTLAGAAAAGTGAACAHWRYGTPDRKGVPLSPENRVAYFTEAPPVFMGHNPFQIAVTLLLPAAMAVLVYALMAAATPRDDLGSA
ncbi:MAG TPA: DUF2567 domain-containing protein [Mycobacterium sp.]|uniref:DUF2567 domain-containing protein n=1 Tax=Mycolicibacterium sp. TaxID=2320850 RepID=UPI0025D6DD70|nr:DUF2567 domain-containing protein [Mycolicibacterium sp.]HPX38315.1 DUF2567 domain-containing protein [Mycobacterium sp.]